MYLKESQNLRIDEAGRDLWRSPTPLPLLREGSVCFSRVVQEPNSISLLLNGQLFQFMFLLHKTLYYILLCNYWIILETLLRPLVKRVGSCCAFYIEYYNFFFH